MIEGIVVSAWCGSQLGKTLPHNKTLYDNLVVVTVPDDRETIRVCHANRVRCVITDACYTGGDAFNKGRMILSGVPCLELTDWVLLTDADCFLPPGVRDVVGTLCKQYMYYTVRRHVTHSTASWDLARVTDEHRLDPIGNDGPYGYFQLFHATTGEGVLRNIPTCFCSAGTIDVWMYLQWPKGARKRLPPDKYITLHLHHGRILGARWNGVLYPIVGWRYAGLTTIKPEQYWQSRWPVPCWVRRVCVETLKQEVALYCGGEVQWQDKPKKQYMYEFSVKPISNEAVEDQEGLGVGQGDEHDGI